MTGLLTYGSLMHPAEVTRYFNRDLLRVPVRVQGFQRSFSQEPSWRTGRADERGVLTVRADVRRWFNAILVCGCDDHTLLDLDDRERGYARMTVSVSAIEPYSAADLTRLVSRVFVYAGRDDKWNADLRPNSDYLALCIDAAGQWGRQFRDDFIATTTVGNVPLASVISND